MFFFVGYFNVQLGEFCVECIIGDFVWVLAVIVGLDGSIYVFGFVVNGFNNFVGNVNDVIVVCIDNIN